MAARRLFTNIWMQGDGRAKISCFEKRNSEGVTGSCLTKSSGSIVTCNLPVYSSLLLIQTRNKISKTSPFGKSNTRQKNINETMRKMPHLVKMVKPRQYERPLIIDSPGMIFSEYLPIRKEFFFTPAGVKERLGAFKAGFQTVYSIALIRKHVKPFKVKDFAKEAQDLYIDLNDAVVRKDKHKLQELATSKIYLALRQEYFPPDRQLHWRFVSEVQRPKVVHVHVSPLETKDNLFAQVTVKIHSKQVVALKDRYGRHIKGSDKDIKEVVDFVVFERHLINNYGKWRVCGKLFPQPPLKEQNTRGQLVKAAPSG